MIPQAETYTADGATYFCRSFPDGRFVATLADGSIRFRTQAERPEIGAEAVARVKSAIKSVKGRAMCSRLMDLLNAASALTELALGAAEVQRDNQPAPIRSAASSSADGWSVQTVTLPAVDVNGTSYNGLFRGPVWVPDGVANPEAGWMILTAERDAACAKWVAHPPTLVHMATGAALLMQDESGNAKEAIQRAKSLSAKIHARFDGFTDADDPQVTPIQYASLCKLIRRHGFTPMPQDA